MLQLRLAPIPSRKHILAITPLDGSRQVVRRLLANGWTETDTPASAIAVFDRPVSDWRKAISLSFAYTDPWPGLPSDHLIVVAINTTPAENAQIGALIRGAQ